MMTIKKNTLAVGSLEFHDGTFSWQADQELDEFLKSVLEHGVSVMWHVNGENGEPDRYETHSVRVDHPDFQSELVRALALRGYELAVQ